MIRLAAHTHRADRLQVGFGASRPYQEDRLNAVRVLHVTECFAGGVANAITKITQLAEADHFLLCSGNDLPSESTSIAGVFQLPARPLAAIAAIRKANALTHPDVIHAHSSWAGVYTRLSGVKTPIIYQPHCYKFDDPGQARIVRAGFFLAEKVLAPRADRVAVLSAHEGELAASLDRETVLHFIPNAPSLTPLPNYESTDFRISPQVIMVGRLCKQKSPEFYAQLADEVRRTRSDVHFQWIGDGDPKLRALLEDSGVAVTGWASGQALAAHYARPSVYFHSALYEGFPLSILEAASFGHPLVARTIPALRDTGIPSAASPAECARLLVDCFAGGRVYGQAVEAARSLCRSMNDANQRSSLCTLYRYYS